MLYYNNQFTIVVLSRKMERPTFYGPNHWIFLHIELWRVSFVHIRLALQCNSSGPPTACLEWRNEKVVFGQLLYSQWTAEVANTNFTTCISSAYSGKVSISSLPDAVTMTSSWTGGSPFIKKNLCCLSCYAMVIFCFPDPHATVFHLHKLANMTSTLHLTRRHLGRMFYVHRYHTRSTEKNTPSEWISQYVIAQFILNFQVSPELIKGPSW